MQKEREFSLPIRPASGLNIHLKSGLLRLAVFSSPSVASKLRYVVLVLFWSNFSKEKVHCQKCSKQLKQLFLGQHVEFA